MRYIGYCVHFQLSGEPNQTMSQLNPIPPVNFIDTSALVKALVKEDGSDVILPLFEGGPPLYTTELCVGETLGVLKLKYLRGDLSKDGYFAAAYYFTALLRETNLNIKSVPITDQDIYFEAEDIGKQHDIDLADALQIVNLLHLGLKSRIITADEQLAITARKIGLEVWDCLREPKPDDLE